MSLRCAAPSRTSANFPTAAAVTSSDDARRPRCADARASRARAPRRVSDGVHEPPENAACRLPRYARGTTSPRVAGPRDAIALDCIRSRRAKPLVEPPFVMVPSGLQLRAAAPTPPTVAPRHSREWTETSSSPHGDEAPRSRESLSDWSAVSPARSPEVATAAERQAHENATGIGYASFLFARRSCAQSLRARRRRAMHVPAGRART